METKHPPTKQFSFINWLGWFVGLNLAWLVLAALAVWLGLRSYTLTTTGEVTQGTVVRLLEEEVSFTSSFTPVLQFQVDGQTYEFHSQNSYRWWNRYFRFSEGNQVEIRYDPANPELAEVNSFWDVWNETIFLAVFTFLSAIGVNIYLMMRWRAEHK